MSALQDQHTPSSLVGLLREPADFYQGLSVSAATTLPRNLLCFGRTSGGLLASQNHASFHHHRHVLILNLGGSGKVFVNDDAAVFAKGEALLIRPLQFHHYAVPRQRPLCWLFITFELDSVFAGETFVENWSNESLEPLLEMFLQSYLAATNGTSGAEQVRQGETAAFLLGAILVRLFRRSEPSVRARQENSHWFGRIQEKIRAEPGIKLASLCRALGVSESTLRRHFQHSGGDSLGAYLIELRFHLALDNLRRSDINLTEISFLAGYDSLQAFSRAFKNRTGMSPREYRKRAIR